MLATDWFAPSPAVTALISDRRAIHFFDRGRRLSAMLGGADNVEHLAPVSQIGFRMKDVLWDLALVYPHGARWGAPAALAAAPVVRERERIGESLEPR